MKNKGFSLVELIVVIAIMAILVGVAVPVYSSYIEKTQKAKDEQLVGEIKHALEIASIGETWGTKYGITDSTYIGAIVLSPDANASVRQETVIGTALHDALVQTFGADYETKLKLSYDGWEGSLAGGNLDVLLGSNFSGNVPTLMEDINSLTGALKTLLSVDNFDKLLDGSFGTWLDKETTVDKTNADKTAVANAAILYVANNATNVNKDVFVAKWKSGEVGDLMLASKSMGVSKLSAVAAEYAKAEAVVGWMGCAALQTGFSQASAGLGNIKTEAELETAFDPLVLLFNEHITVDACASCANKIKDYGDYYKAYAADPARCEQDAKAYLALLGQVSASEDKILSDIDNPNLYAEESLTSYVNHFVSVAGVLSQINAPKGTVVIVFSMNANGVLMSNVYPLDYIG